MKLRVLALSDVVNPKLYSPLILEYKERVDLVISCGDLPAYYLDFVVTSLGKPLFFVCGNHDSYEFDKRFRPPTPIINKNLLTDNAIIQQRIGGYNLDGRIEIYSGFIFLGLEGSINYNRGVHQYSNKEMERKILKLKPLLWWNKLTRGRFVDVVVTHAPPYGIHDREDFAHRGFESFINLIKKYSPSYVLHGHSHIYDKREERITLIGSTKVVNCYDYILLDLEI